MSIDASQTSQMSQEPPKTIDLTYTTEEDDEEEGERLEGFVVSDSDVEYLSDDTEDDVAIVKQLPQVSELGTRVCEGRRRSTRVSKPTDRYVHPDYDEVNKDFIVEEGDYCTSESEADPEESDWDVGQADSEGSEASDVDI